MRNIENTRTSGTAGQARTHLATFFSWAITGGDLGKNPVNPVVGTRIPPSPPPQTRVLSNDELVALWQETADDMPDDDDWPLCFRVRNRNSRRKFHHILRLLLLTGARRNEIANLPWSELDLTARVWTLPVERSKTKRPPTLVLSGAAFGIISAQPRGSEYVFPGVSEQGGFWIRMGIKEALDRRLGDRVRPWHVHDLRRSAATHMANIGILPHVIDAAQNHVVGTRVSRTYNRSTYDREVTVALQRWSEHLLALVEGRVDDNVVSLRGAY